MTLSALYNIVNEYGQNMSEENTPGQDNTPESGNPPEEETTPGQDNTSKEENTNLDNFFFATSIMLWVMLVLICLTFILMFFNW